MKIATHNSATRKKGKGLLSWFATPFARCQSKSIKEQYDAGCRWFDIRVKQDTKYDGQFYVCHGVSYKGSKNKIAEELARAIPHPHGGNTHFYDLFAGGCAVMHVLMQQHAFKHYHINDTDRSAARDAQG